MDQLDALNILEEYRRIHGAIDGFDRLSEKLGVNPNTIYGWWRRSSIPQWRLASFAKLKPRKKRSA